MQHKDYYDALERLRSNQPELLLKGSYKINQDTVALEAGRKRGAIKPSRSQFTKLIDDINRVSHEYNNKALNKINKIQASADRYRSNGDDLREKYLAALNREMMLVRRLRDLEMKVIELEAEQKVVHIRN
ncbi:Putative uncharacterized protein [Moritella viscosa]|uniref:hypothetical protein n=1 Tax=Moritella viscosa TaxID=80854 RepID=UPI000910F7F7|nr:hypothetical protein [Moritella viscosa]SGY88056.1 Putative uncharacterized protein [Moritella viscosa]